MSPWAKLGISFTFVFVICRVSWNENDRTFLPKVWSMKKFKIYLNASFLTHKLGKEIDEFSIEKGAYFTHLQSAKQAGKGLLTTITFRLNKFTSCSYVCMLFSNCSGCLCIHKLLLPMISSRAIEMSTLRFLDSSNGRNRLFSSLGLKGGQLSWQEFES